MFDIFAGYDRSWLDSDSLTRGPASPLYPGKQTSKGVAVTLPFRDSLTGLPASAG